MRRVHWRESDAVYCGVFPSLKPSQALSTLPFDPTHSLVPSTTRSLPLVRFTLTDASLQVRSFESKPYEPRALLPLKRTSTMTQARLFKIHLRISILSILDSVDPESALLNPMAGVVL